MLTKAILSKATLFQFCKLYYIIFRVSFFQLSFKDPVFCISLRDFVMSQLTEYQRQQGTPKFEELMQSIDIEIQQQLQQFFK